MTIIVYDSDCGLGYVAFAGNVLNHEKQYGDEGLGYHALARDMSSDDARGHLDSLFADGLTEKIPPERLNALRIRAEEETQ